MQAVKRREANITLTDILSWWPKREGQNPGFNEVFKKVVRTWCCADDNHHVTIQLDLPPQGGFFSRILW